jgi:WD40 repeat protein
VDSAVLSLTLSANQAEVFIGCSNGKTYRCLVGDHSLTLAEVSTSHTTPISCIGFSRRSAVEQSRKMRGIQETSSSTNMFFATGTISGELRVWDLTDYACVSLVRFPKSGAVKCICMVDDNNILTGWQDGAIRCTDRSGRELWCLATAHRDGTLSIAIHMDMNSFDIPYLVSGGNDGAVRVWKYRNRELILQYSEHRKGVQKVLIDEKSPNIVHSEGGDSSILSYDLKAARRIMSHIVNTGSFICMTQRKDSEQELITSDHLGRLLYWDIDVRDPVLAIQDPSRLPILACEVSPTGRYLAFAGEDFILKVLDLKTQEIVSLGQSHSAPITALAWTPDERQIITGGQDCCLSVWNFLFGGGPM